MDIESVKECVCGELYSRMPISVAVIDSNLRIVEANNAFVQAFGAWKNRYCYEAFKSSPQQCDHCDALKTFSDGKARTNQVTGTDRQGNSVRYMVHLFPLVADDGSIPYMIEMAVDTTVVSELQERYQLLFDRTPCYIAIIDRNFQIIQANNKFRTTFGEPSGGFCHQLYKRSSDICENCPALKTFETGKEHTTQQTGLDVSGKKTHYMVTTAPLTKSPGGSVETVMEIAFDVSRVVELEEQIRRMFDLQETVIASSMDALVVTDNRDEVIIFNQAAENLFGRPAEDVIGKKGMFSEILPGKFTRAIADTCEPCQLDETIVQEKSGEEIPVRISGSSLHSGKNYLGQAAFLQDLRQIKRLEEEKLTAERLAAVGQTVAGLAHGIKNIITGLEGGLYVMKAGIQKNDIDRLGKGLSMLDSNIHRISHFVKEFLNFARGRTPQVDETDPNQIAKEVYELYNEAASQVGIEMTLDLQEDIKPANMDKEGIHACLSNLLSNAIDACQMSEKDEGIVTLRTKEKDGTIIFEVTDNGIGMDYDVKKKVFTSFFSTKGSHEGTGLGLLVTKKTVQEHGGRIEFDSQPEEGTRFTLEFPRNRLPEPTPGETGS